jgi:hypothetical protein
MACPASPKKRETVTDSAVSIVDGTLLQAIEYAMAKALEDFGAPAAAGDSPEDLQSLRGEIERNTGKVQTKRMQLVSTAMERMQKDADRRADAMLQRLEQMLNNSQRQDKDRVPLSSRDSFPAGHVTEGPVRQGQQQPARVAQPSWADITGMGAQTSTGWITVMNGKKKSKKHPLDQRRILFARNSQSHTCDPRDIMFKVNKALAHARAHVTARLINLRYTEKSNLSRVVREKACAEDMLANAAIVMPAVQELDPAVVDLEKTEKWHKLRVHDVALDRYMSEGGPDVGREEIELTTGEQLPYAPRWTKADRHVRETQLKCVADHRERRLSWNKMIS